MVGVSDNLDTGEENVDIAIALPGGTELGTVEVSLSPDGREAEIGFDWPQELYLMDELFSDETNPRNALIRRFRR